MEQQNITFIYLANVSQFFVLILTHDKPSCLRFFNHFAIAGGNAKKVGQSSVLEAGENHLYLSRVEQLYIILFGLKISIESILLGLEKIHLQLGK